MLVGITALVNCSGSAAEVGASGADAGLFLPTPSPSPSPSPGDNALAVRERGSPVHAVLDPDPGSDVDSRTTFAMAVSSSIRDDSGATYWAGVFVGRIRGGGAVLVSHGDADVFVVKQAPDGAIDWAVSVGSAARESSPRVTLETADSGRDVVLLGLTRGAMDCGRGPLPTWSSDTFFMCIFSGLNGASTAGGVFPTGNP
jgi:hypothetical protein